MNQDFKAVRDIFQGSLGLILAGLLASCATDADRTGSSTVLKDAFEDSFLVGVAINEAQFSGKDPRGETIITRHFNSVSPENVLKWESVHPEPHRYTFDAADRYVAFGEQHGMRIIGHTLVWHNQTPKWVFEDASGRPVDRETLLKRMREHIHTVVGRYKGRIHGWDVANEVIFPDGGWRTTNRWYQIIGEDFVAKAFQYAHEADPKAELYYNDFALEDELKRKGVMALVKRLQAQGIPIHGIGSQMHARLDWPSIAAIETHLLELASLGIKVMITELDIDVLPEARQHRGMDLSRNAAMNATLNPYTNGLPESVEHAFTQRYADIFHIFQKHRDKIDRVTFWCVTDADSWLNYWPVTPRVNYPLLFDRHGRSKPAFAAVLKRAR